MTMQFYPPQEGWSQGVRQYEYSQYWTPSPAPVFKQCKGGHRFALRWALEVSKCRNCSGPCRSGSLVKSCEMCNFTVCENCSTKVGQVPKVAASKGATMMAQNATMAAAHSLYILQPQGHVSQSFVTAAAGGQVPQSFVSPVIGGDKPRSYVPAPAGGDALRSYVPAPAGGDALRSYVPAPAGGDKPRSYIPAPAGGDKPRSYIPAPAGGDKPRSYIPAPAGGDKPRSYIPAPAGGDKPRSYIPAPAGGEAARSYVPAPVGGLMDFLPPRPCGATMTMPSTPQFTPTVNLASTLPKTRTGPRAMSQVATVPLPPPIESFVAPPTWPGTQPNLEAKQKKADTPISKKSSVTLDEFIALPQNQECADCGAPAPEWASVNQGTLICIDCAGTHRSMGAHISKVKSVKLDSWKSEEVESFTAKGGNQKVNAHLLGSRPKGSELLRRPTKGASRASWDQYIRKKYKADVKKSTEKAAAKLQRDVSCHMGTTCHQGLVMVDIASVDIGVERARDLRTFGSFFLNLSVNLSLGSQISDATTTRRGSEKAGWSPPERKQMLWDAQERYLWCRVYDSDLGFKQLAGEGRIDLLKFLDKGGASEGIAEEVEVELFASEEDQANDSDSEASPTSVATSAATFSKLQDPSDPARGGLIGLAKLQLTIIDMTGMLKTQARKSISQSPWGSSGSE